MKRRFKSEADIARFIKDGYGQGEGSSYKPWLRVQDVSSRGRSRKTPGFKTGRKHHTLSDLEFFYLLLLEFSDEVMDIREQYPLFAASRARDIAAEMGIAYPKYPGTQLPLVITSDFALTLQVPEEKTRLVIRTCKYEKELADSEKGPRVIEKLELEKAIWAEHGVTDWKVVTDRLMTPTLMYNLDWLHSSAWVDKAIATEEQKLRFIEAAVHTRDVAVHPMRHLLLMDCLRDTLPGHLENDAPDPPKAVARNEGRRQVDQARLSETLGQEGASLRQAAAELGFSVTTLGIEATRLGLPVGRRPKTITEDVKCRVSAALRCGLAPKEVAETHGLSQVSVYRILRMDEALAREYAGQRLKLRRDARRERFASHTPDQADYVWLYRNDREWLTKQQAIASKGEPQREPSIDWAERDKLLAQQVARTSDAMRCAAERPRWISRSALGQETGMVDTIERNADKLPITHQALSARSETREEYQRRRLYWAAGELKKLLAVPPPRWRLLRQAGIRVLAKNNEMLVETLTTL